jgi:hypothetical protein
MSGYHASMETEQHGDEHDQDTVDEATDAGESASNTDADEKARNVDEHLTDENH